MRIRALLRQVAVLSVVAASLLALPAGPASATTSDDSNAVQITMSPTSVDVDMTPGATLDGEMIVINSGTEPIRFDVYAQPYSVVNSDYEPDFASETARTQIARWVSFEATSYAAEPGEEIAVPYRITVPEDVPDGGQYAVLFAETEPEGDTSGVATTRRVGMLVYASVPGTTRESGSVERADVGFWQTADPLIVSETITNDGNTDFTATTRYRLISLLGGVTEQEQTRAVLPETERRIDIELDTAPFGIYTLERTTALPDGDEVEEQQTIVVLHPTLAIVLGVALVLLLGAVILLIVRRRRRARSTT